MPRNRGVLLSLAPTIASRNSPDSFRRTLAAGSGLLALSLAASLWFANPGQAQEGQIIFPGSMAVTGFSGTVIPGIEEGLPPGVDPVDETFIDTDARNLARFRRFSAWRSAFRAARLYAAALRGSRQPDRPGLRPDL